MTTKSKQQQVDDLNLIGYTATLKEDRILVEGESEAGTSWVVEEGFDAYWLYEQSSEFEYHSVDAYGSLDEAIDAGMKLW